MTLDIRQGDLFDVLPTLPADSVDAVVIDPPYGIGMMGKEWDTFKPGVAQLREVPNTDIESDNPNVRGRTRRPASSPSAVEYDRSLSGQKMFQDWCEKWGREVYRVLKPGGYLLSCGAPRSYHRMTCGLENAGFEIRDSLAWVFGTGFPKSLNISKAAPHLSPQWDGWGSATKPGYEPIALARKPFDTTLIKNVEVYGTGGLNIDACRLEPGAGVDRDGEASADRRYTDSGGTNFAMQPGVRGGSPLGRWPANVMFDEEAARDLDEQSGVRVSGKAIGGLHRMSNKFGTVYGHFDGERTEGDVCYGDRGGASRFFFCPKVSKREREHGCEDLPLRTAGEVTGGREEGSAGLNSPRAGAGRTSGNRNTHATVKPIALMRWLVRLVTPPRGTVLDCFMGSGSTGLACQAEGFNFIGIEREAEYVAIAKARLAAEPPLLAIAELTVPSCTAEPIAAA